MVLYNVVICLDRRRAMLFTAPAFAFLFLPLGLIFYMLFGKNNKRRCLLIICCVYHVLLNMSHPLNFIWLPLIAVYTFFARKTAVICAKRVLTVILCAVPLIWLIMMRGMHYFGMDGFVYPVGMTVPALSAVSYIRDCSEDGEAPADFFRLLLYLAFFPVMILGPFVRYRDFCRLTEEENITVSLSGVCEGVKLYAIGFIKRIAVGAVLIEGYQWIFAYSWEAPTFGIVLLLLILVYFGVFFSVAGYYDMGVGISRIFGRDVPRVDANPFTVATFNEYSKTLFGSVRIWAENYILVPVRDIRGKKETGFVRVAVYCMCIFLLVRSQFTMLILIIPLIAFSIASASLRLDKMRGKSNAGLRGVFGMLNILVLGVFWVFVTMGGDNSVLQYISEVTVNNAEYQADMVLISFSGSKYLFVSLTAFCTVMPQMSSVKAVYSRMSPRMRAVADYGAMFVMLALFVFTAMFFLPQFPEYNTTPFNYLII